MGVRYRFTVERWSRPLSEYRHLVVTDDGGFAWGAFDKPILIFCGRRRAEAFVCFRMDRHADDACVVRHAVH